MWVVYSKAPCGGPQQVLRYLSRYTHRITLANRRILAVAGGLVRFEWHDYASGYQRRELALPATEFLRRFLLHVVPRGFMRIRHYGITANCHRGRQLQRCRELLGSPQVAATGSELTPLTATTDTATAAADSSVTLCPNCGAPLRIIEILTATRSDFLAAPNPPDTS